jgi:formamidopyrimidine-DNA glycosylase
MPELPEVETIVRQLQRQIIDRIITKIEKPTY